MLPHPPGKEPTTPAAADPVPPTVAAVLVTYESAADLPGCLESLAKAAQPDGVEVVVVDNASHDESAELARALGVKVVENPTNEGYARAVNAGAAATGGRWLLVLNPDTRLTPDSLSRLLATGEADPGIGCLGPELHNPDGTEYPTGRRFPSLVVGGLHAFLGPIWPGNPATRHYHMAEADRSAPLRVDWVSGACMLLRREAFDAVGGFDGGYFMYFEDMDICLRLARTGWRVVFDPGAEVVHVGGNSTRKAPYRKVVNHHRSTLRFYCRRYARDPRILLAPAVAAFLLLRGVLSLARTAGRGRSA
jgi:N-acetylglucosaminyl-diphospho-decaprenol L-rhamnosyltransferase